MTGHRDFITEFLFAGSPVECGGGKARADVLMDLRAEGWVGLPHGGIGMAAIVELGSCLDYPGDIIPHPFTVDYRLGGSRLRVGDRVCIEAERAQGGITGKIVPAGCDAPYLSAALSWEGREKQDAFKGVLPARFSDIEGRLKPLPYYKNCFVCGVERKEPGLKRKFQLLDSPDEKLIVSLAGFAPEDSGSFYLFQRNGFLHPVALLALLDETLGWAGFMISASGGVTTRISYAFLRKVAVGEKIAVFARGDRLRGTASRTFYWASGAAAVVKDSGEFEVVASASGQYFGMRELTEQMKTELMPADINARAFAVAESWSRHFRG